MIAIEQGYNTPFEIKRVYYIFDTKLGVERGFHAHINLKQIAIVVKGSCTFVLDNGDKREEIKLDNPNKGLFIEGLIWREMKDFSPDCVLVVLASENELGWKADENFDTGIVKTIEWYLNKYGISK